jgi:ribonuclease HII
MKKNEVCAEIIDDSDDDRENNEIIIKKKTTKKIQQNYVKKCYNEDPNIFEIGVDEVGRGPLFGRVYTAAVILPKDDSFDFSKMKDSKKFHSKKKIEDVANYIKENAVAWHVSYEDEQTIDEMNILQATQKSMHHSIQKVIEKIKNQNENTNIHFQLLIDGNYFNPYTILNKEKNKMEVLPYVTIEGGDNKYAAISAASILAKVERDKYIHELCIQYPELIDHYSIDSNKGYGAKKHLEGIKTHGITIWHRRSFAPCKNYV